MLEQKKGLKSPKSPISPNFEEKAAEVPEKNEAVKKSPKTKEKGDKKKTTTSKKHKKTK